MPLYLVFWGCDVIEIFRHQKNAEKYIEENGGYDKLHLEIWTIKED